MASNECFHFTKLKNLYSIRNDGLQPKLDKNSKAIGDIKPKISFSIGKIGAVGLFLEFYRVYSDYKNDAKYVGFTFDNNTHECTKTNPCEITYSNGNFSNANFGGTNNRIKNTIEEWYSENLNSVDSKIFSGYFCNDSSYGGIEDSWHYYGTYQRNAYNNQPSLQCPNPTNQSNNLNKFGGIYKTKVGLITADELVFGGYPATSYEKVLDSSEYTSQYLISSNYLWKNYIYFTMTPGLDSILISSAGGYNSKGVVPGMMGYGYGIGTQTASQDIYPVINIKADVQVSGNGTSSNPFIVN